MKFHGKHAMPAAAAARAPIPDIIEGEVEIRRRFDQDAADIGLSSSEAMARLERGDVGQEPAWDELKHLFLLLR